MCVARGTCDLMQVRGEEDGLCVARGTVRGCRVSWVCIQQAQGDCFATWAVEPLSSRLQQQLQSAATDCST